MTDALLEEETVATSPAGRVGGFTATRVYGVMSCLKPLLDYSSLTYTSIVYAHFVTAKVSITLVLVYTILYSQSFYESFLTPIQMVVTVFFFK